MTAAVVLTFAATLLQLQSLLAVSEKQPNIVFIIADDYGYKDIGYHGAEFATPTLDKLAAGGLKLENYYVQPICSPTRSQLMTGRYQIHTGLQHDIIWPSQPYGVSLEYPTLANVLKEHGYSTHAIGKWHLGLYKREYTPLHRGFDTFYGYWEGGEDYYTYYNCDWSHKAEGGDRSSRLGNENFCGYDLRDMERQVTDKNGTYSTLLYTHKAVDLLKGKTAADKPFFLYLAYQAVHSPMEAPESYIKPYEHIQNKYRRIYAGMVSALDEGVKNVTDTLKQTGLWNNTLLVFTTGITRVSLHRLYLKLHPTAKLRLGLELRISLGQGLWMRLKIGLGMRSWDWDRGWG
ncbi:arylsulfatase b [Plakobranchus ocellatus]|uniref:Arylsulfatase b n=1 Tax=Plakobranchus ocellatus TaxID=259542 RepID=A0AAV4DMQ4_9GAST|nr:arylsulfatase b [Plakobranchus ocellatus]